MRTNVPVRATEGSIIGKTGGRAAGCEGLQGSWHVVAIQWGDAGAIWVRRAGCRRPRDVVARWGRARAARRRRYHRDRTWRYIVTLVRIAATSVVDGIPRAVAAADISPCAGRSLPIWQKGWREISLGSGLPGVRELTCLSVFNGMFRKISTTSPQELFVRRTTGSIIYLAKVW